MTVFQIDQAKEISPRAYLVCVATGRESHPDAPEELTELVRSDGLDPVGMMLAKRDKPDPATYLGSGKIEELKYEVEETAAGLVVFDVALTAAQQRNIERAVGVPILDRTQLILEIFQRRARSKEGRLQVELARLEHLSTRLVRGWTHLERQRGGLSKTGGPGEKQIELDRRMIGVRIKQLREQLKKLSRQRDTQRKGRHRSETVSLSIVGYTNAGKSTLFNTLTKSSVYAENQLFATLDTTARRCYVGDGESVVLSDTVGFIRGLPHQLVEAFSPRWMKRFMPIFSYMWWMLRALPRTIKSLKSIRCWQKSMLMRFRQSLCSIRLTKRTWSPKSFAILWVKSKPFVSLR